MRTSSSPSTVESLESRRLFSTIAVLAGTTIAYVDSAVPQKTLAKVAVKGLVKGDKLIGIDFRPSTGQLYGLGAKSRLYLIDPTSGKATNVEGNGQAFSPALVGTGFGVGFSPVSDLMRVVSDVDVNFRLYSPTGFVIDYDENTPGTQTDLPLAYTDGDVHAGSNPNVEGIAYTRLAGGESTAYGIDTDNDSLVRLGAVGGDTQPRDSGKLTTIGTLGVDTASQVGFDIDTNGSADVAYSSLSLDAKHSSTLYTVNLSTGAATPVGDLKISKKPAMDIAVVPAGHTLLTIDSKNRLTTLDSNLPNVPQSVVAVTGLASKEKLVAIARRPTDGLLYGFTNQYRLYVVNRSTGVATSTGEPTAITLKKGSKIALDFDPNTGFARVIDNQGNNYRVNPANGQIVDTDSVLDATQVDTPVVFTSTDVHANSRGRISGLAFGTSPTTLFAIDPTKDILVTVGSSGGSTSANTGQLFTVGGLGVDADESRSVGFDSLSFNNSQVTFATFKPKSGKTSLYSVDLSSGVASATGWLPSSLTPVGLVILA